MLVWINGPFGGGKTQVAHEIRRRLPDSLVCDPEEVGFGLHRMMPRSMRTDFQDLAAWRQGVVEVLDLVLRRHAEQVILAPMTVIEPAYFEQTVGRLREGGHDVRHVALLAERDTVRRLRERGLGHVLQLALASRDAPLRQESFAVSRLDTCLERLQEPLFAEQLWTDRITVPEVADRVAALAGLALLPDTDTALRGRIRRAVIGAKHIRLG